MVVKIKFLILSYVKFYDNEKRKLEIVFINNLLYINNLLH